MKVLTLTNMYPTKDRPYFGIFVKEQVEALQSLYPEADIEHLFIDGSNPIMKYLWSVLAIARNLLSFKPDILHVHFGLTMLPVFFIMPLIWLMKIKLVLTVHGGDVVGDNKAVLLITRLGILLSQKVICVSDQMTKVVAKYTKNFMYLPCGVTPVFKEVERQRELIVVFPSSPSRPEKNYDRFVNIIEQLKCETDVKFEVALLEDLNREQVAELFQKSAVMLMTSDYEGSPQAVKEAIYCGLPVVSTPAGDVSILLDEQELCLVSVDDEALKNAVKYILEQRPPIKYSESLKQSVSNEFICEKLFSCYQSMKI